MKKRLFILMIITTFMLCQCNVYRKNYKAFTHPIDTNHISIYKKPYVLYKYISADPNEGGGWIVKIKNKQDDFFKVDILEFKLRNIWIKVGDLGLILQNYDSLKIPIYTMPDTSSNIITYIYKSYIGKLYDISKGFALLELYDYDYDESTGHIGEYYVITKGWVEFKHLCDNQYTTCTGLHK